MSYKAHVTLLIEEDDPHSADAVVASICEGALENPSVLEYTHTEPEVATGSIIRGDTPAMRTLTLDEILDGIEGARQLIGGVLTGVNQGGVGSQYPDLITAYNALDVITSQARD